MTVRATPEKKEEKERIRAALLRAALRLGNEHGFASLGLREVSREAGIAPTSFYRHFADMNELGLDLIHEQVGALVRGLAQRLERPADASATAGVLVDALLEAALKDPELVRFMVAERVGSFPSFRAALRDELAPLATALAKQGAKEPSIPPYVAQAALVVLLDGFARTIEPDTESPPALRAQLVSALTQLLEPGEPGRRRS